MLIEITDKDIFIKNNETHFIYNECEYEIMENCPTLNGIDNCLCLYKVDDVESLNLISQIKYKDKVFTLISRFYDCFKDANSLKEINIDKPICFSTDNGVLYYHNHLIYYPPQKRDKKYYVKKGTYLPHGEFGFEQNPYLEEIVYNKYHIIKNKNNKFSIKHG